MVQSLTHQNIAEWVTVCDLDRVLPNTGVCALVAGQQVAVFHWQSPIEAGLSESGSVVYAIDNFDPFSQAYVLSRGIVGDRGGVPKVASPIYKQNFSLQTGECLDDGAVRVMTYPTRVLEGQIQVGVVAA
jgi:nitrite reductase (NADH) small subunit